MHDIPMPSFGCHLFNHIAHRFVERDGTTVMEIDIDDSIRGPGGSVHGGVLAILVEIAGSNVLYDQAQRPSVSTALTVQYLGAARVGPLVAVPEILRISASTGVAEVRVYDAGNERRLTTVGQITLTFLPGDAWAPAKSSSELRTRPKSENS